MTRINENTAAEDFVKNIKNGKYSIEHSENIDTSCSEEKADNLAVKEFTKSNLFKQFKKSK